MVGHADNSRQKQPQLHRLRRTWKTDCFRVESAYIACVCLFLGLIAIDTVDFPAR